MNNLIENGLITEKKSDRNFMYILNDSNNFLLTEYKVLQNQNNSDFIRCMKLVYNGKLSLYYETSEYRTLQDIIPALDSSSFLNLAASLLHAVVDVKNNGFLSCQNLDMSFNKIFVNGSNLAVSLVYVPCKNHIYPDYSIFEAELRTNLRNLIRNNPRLQSPITASLERNLSDNSLSLSSLAGYVRGKDINKNDERYAGDTPKTGNTQKLHLIALNSPVHFELVVDRDEFLIGKKAGAVNGLISFNSAISRVHCKIICSSYGYKIEDMGSANGTYVNRQRIAAHKQVPVKNGDIVRLANSDFQILIR